MNATQTNVQTCLYVDELRMLSDKTMLSVNTILSIEKKWTSVSKLVNSMKLLESVTGDIAVYSATNNSVTCNNEEFNGIKAVNRHLNIK